MILLINQISVVYEGLKSCFLELFLKFFDTKSGYTKMTNLRDYIHYVPFSIRRFIISLSLVLPLSLSRLVLRLATSPIGDEKEWIRKVKEKTWKGVWIAPKSESVDQTEDITSNDLVILYTHGGGFCMGHALMYMDTFQLIINHLREEHHLRAVILSVEYTLSPECVWPQALNETMEAYRYLIHDLGFNASKVFLAGDSAGGNLVASMLLEIKKKLNTTQESITFPAGAGLLCPWIDLTPHQSSFVESQKHDLLSSKHISKFLSYYIPNYHQLDNDAKITMIRNPLISPLYASASDFNKTCPIFVAYGEKELLRKSIEDFTANLQREGCDITILKGRKAVHIWLVYSLMASSKQVYENDCKSFINWLASTCKNAQKRII